MVGIAPYAVADQIRVPRKGCDDSDLTLLATAFGAGASTYRHQEGDLEGVEPGEQRAVQQREQHGGRDGVLDMANGGQSVTELSQGVSTVLPRTQWHTLGPWRRRQGNGLMCPGKRAARVKWKTRAQIRRLGHGRVVSGTVLAAGRAAMVGVLRLR